MVIFCHLASLTFLAAPWLSLLALAALPVAIHLLGNRTRRTVIIPTARFFIQTRAETAHRTRVRDWLLLIIRCTAIAAVVLAFAQPAWNSQAGAPVPGDRRPSAPPVRLPTTSTGRDTVIIIDASASMQRIDRGQSMFAEAVRQAQDRLSGLSPASDRAGVLLAGVRPDPILPDLTTDLQTLRDRLDTAEPTWERADLQQAIMHATRLLNRATGSDRNQPDPPMREIVIFTDMQANQWPTPSDSQSLPSWFTGADVPTRVTLRQVGSSAPVDNISITEITTVPAVPLAGVPSIVRLSLHNHAPNDAAIISATLSVDGTEIGTAVCSIPPGQTYHMSASHTFATRGLYRVRGSLSSDLPDAMQIDDLQDVCIAVRSRYQVGLISQSPDTDSAYYISRALAPDTTSPFVVTYVGTDVPSYSDSSPISQHDALIVCELPDVTDQDVVRLQDWAAYAGLGVIWFVDTPETADLLSRISESELLTGQLPLSVSGWNTGPLSSGRDNAVSSVPLSVSTNNDVLAAFLNSTGDTGQNVSEVLQDIMKESTHRPEATATLGARVDLSSADGRPIIASHPVGHGRLAMWCGSIRPSHNQLARTPVFPALMQEFVRSVAATPQSAPSCFVGQECSVPLTRALNAADHADVKVNDIAVAPDDVAFTLVGTADTLEARIGQTGFPGIVLFQYRTTGTSLAGATVLLDPRESDLRSVSPEHILPRGQSRLADVDDAPPSQSTDRESSQIVSASGTTSAASLSRMNRTVQLWPVLTLAAILLLAAQAALAQRPSANRTMHAAEQPRRRMKGVA